MRTGSQTGESQFAGEFQLSVSLPPGVQADVVLPPAAIDLALQGG